MSQTTANTGLPQPELNRVAWVSIYISRFCKIVIAFSGIFTVMVATDYPGYNVLIFSEKKGDVALAALAHAKFSNALLYLLLSLLFAGVASAVLPAARLSLHLDQHEHRRDLIRLYNSRWTVAFIVFLTVASVIFAFWGYQQVARFFDMSVPGCVLNQQCIDAVNAK